MSHLGFNRIQSVSDDERALIVSLTMRNNGDSLKATMRLEKSIVVSFDDFPELGFCTGTADWLEAAKRVELWTQEAAAHSMFSDEFVANNLAIIVESNLYHVLIDRGCVLKVQIERTVSSLPLLRLELIQWSDETHRLTFETRLQEWREIVDKEAKFDAETWARLFPRPDPDRVSCGICSQLWLDGVPAGTLCDGCAMCFHAACVAEWMQSDPSSKRIFDQLTGKCPSCDSSLMVAL